MTVTVIATRHKDDLERYKGLGLGYSRPQFGHQGPCTMALPRLGLALKQAMASFPFSGYTTPQSRGHRQILKPGLV